MPQVNVMDFIPGAPNITVGIQNAHNAAGVNGTVLYPAGTYDINDTIQVLGGQSVIGDGQGSTVIQLLNSPKPVLRFHYGRTSKLIGFRITGSENQPGNHGVVFSGYYSLIESVMIEGVGGRGIFFDTTGLTPEEKMIDNILINVTVQAIGGDCCYFLGAADNNKATDGFMVNCIAQAGPNTTSHIFIGSGSGWTINNIHTYGSHIPACSIEIQNAFHTKLDNIYIEGFRNFGLKLLKIQRALTLSNLSFDGNISESQGKYIYLSKTSLPDIPTVNIANLTLFQETNSNPTTGIYSETSAVQVSCTNYQIEGTNRFLVAKYGGIINVRKLDNPVQQESKIVVGDTSQTFDVLMYVTRYNKVIGTVSIIANKYDNHQDVRAYYQAVLMISAKNNDVNDPWGIVVRDIISPFGFQSTPQYSINNPGGDFRTLTISFRFANSDATGMATFQYSNPSF